MRDGAQRVDGVQFVALILGVVDPGDPQAQFETERRIVAQPGGHVQQVFALHVEGDLAAVHHDPADRGVVGCPDLFQGAFERVGDFVEVGRARVAGVAVGTLGGGGHVPVDAQPSVAGRVAGGFGTEHAHAGDRRIDALRPQLSGKVVLFW